MAVALIITLTQDGRCSSISSNFIRNLSCGQTSILQLNGQELLLHGTQPFEAKLITELDIVVQLSLDPGFAVVEVLADRAELLFLLDL
jgi:hypothetical protein